MGVDKGFEWAWKRVYVGVNKGARMGVKKGVSERE